jgi:hypothetical protein
MKLHSERSWQYLACLPVLTQVRYTRARKVVTGLADHFAEARSAGDAYLRPGGILPALVTWSGVSTMPAHLANPAHKKRLSGHGSCLPSAGAMVSLKPAFWRLLDATGSSR